MFMQITAQPRACEERIGRTKYVPRRGASSNGQDEVLSASDKMIGPHDYAGRPKENETFPEGIFDGDEGNADDSDDEKAEVEDDCYDDEEVVPTKLMKARVKSPIKSKWLVPLVKGALAEKPNISNKALTILLSPYIVEKFLTHSLINQTK